MNWFLSIVVLILGLVLIGCAFVFYAANGIPYPDATAELIAYQSAQAKKYTMGMLAGFVVFAAGVYLLVSQTRARRKKQ